MKIQYDEKGIPCIGGWLYLIGISVLGNFIWSVIWFLSEFSRSSFNASSPDSLIVFFFAGMMLFSAVIMINFFKKRDCFPKQYIIYTISITILFIFLMPSLNMLANEKAKAIIPIIVSIIYILYLINSKRVKYTFVVNKYGHVTLYPPENFIAQNKQDIIHKSNKTINLEKTYTSSENSETRKGVQDNTAPKRSHICPAKG